MASLAIGAREFRRTTKGHCVDDPFRRCIDDADIIAGGDTTSYVSMDRYRWRNC